jgi:molybdopterin-guanine dinucleotide biosynthesis protein A
MGRPKAWLRFGGRPALDYLLDRFAWPGPTLLVTAPGHEHPPGWQRFMAEATDPVPAQGPLRGVLTALEHCRTDVLLVTTVDMPHVAAPHLLWLAAELCARPEALGVLPVRRAAAEQVEPFPCALARSAKSAVAAHLAEGRRSVHSLLARPGFTRVTAPADWGELVWTNLNLPSDLQAFLHPPGGD